MADKEYIECEAVEKYIESLYQPWEHKFQDRDNIKGRLERIPTADVVEVKRGEWIKHPLADGVVYCSQCGNWRDSRSGAYCSWCGADMRGKVNENQTEQG